MAVPFAPTIATDESTINDTTMRRHVPRINGATLWTSIEPYVRQAVALYIIPFIGQALYDTTMAKADAEPDKQQLLDAIGYYTMVIAWPKMSGILSDAGVQQGTGGEGTTTMGIGMYKITHLDLTLTADKHLDRFMQGQELPDTAEGKMMLFDSVAEYQQYHHINHSLRTYRSLVPYERKAYERYVAPYVSEAIDLIRAADTAPYRALRYKVQLALASYTIHVAAPNLSLLVDGEGMRTLSSSDSLVGTAAAGYREALAVVIGKAKEDGDTFVNDLHEFIRINIDDYPALKDTGRFDEELDSFDVMTSHDGEGSVIGFFS